MSSEVVRLLERLERTDLSNALGMKSRPSYYLVIWSYSQLALSILMIENGDKVVDMA